MMSEWKTIEMHKIWISTKFITISVEKDADYVPKGKYVYE